MAHTFFFNSPEPQRTVSFGRAGDVPLIGNWEGTSGVDTIGVYRPSDATFYLQLPNGAVLTRRYGRVGDQPVVGDWGGTGATTIGVRRGNVFYLATSNNELISRTPFTFGEASDRIANSAYASTASDMEILASRS